MATGWNFYEKMQDRVLTLVPDQEEASGPKAWDTRVEGIRVELAIFAEDPIFGKGFGIQEQRGYNYAQNGIHHNSWTDILAKCGLVGITPYILVMIGCMVIGARMVRQNVDRASVLMGALGAIFGPYYIMFGLCTWAFNGIRPAMCLGVFFGLLLRAREYQLAQLEYRGVPDQNLSAPTSPQFQPA